MGEGPGGRGGPTLGNLANAVKTGVPDFADAIPKSPLAAKSRHNTEEASHGRRGNSALVVFLWTSRRGWNPIQPLLLEVRAAFPTPEEIHRNADNRWWGYGMRIFGWQQHPLENPHERCQGVGISSFQDARGPHPDHSAAPESRDPPGNIILSSGKLFHYISIHIHPNTNIDHSANKWHQVEELSHNPNI